MLKSIHNNPLLDNSQDEDVKRFNEKYEQLESNHNIAEEFLIVEEPSLFDFDNFIDIQVQDNDEYKDLTDIKISDVFTPDESLMSFDISDIFSKNSVNPSSINDALENRSSYDNQEELSYIKTDSSLYKEEDSIDILI